MDDHLPLTPSMLGKGHSDAIHLDDELSDDGVFGSIFLVLVDLFLLLLLSHAHE